MSSTIHLLSSCDATTVRWTMAGTLYATMVVKARFALADSFEPIEVAIARADQHHDNSAVRSLREHAELAPFKPQVDIVLNGQAIAPGDGQPVNVCSVRLRLLQSGQPLIDKQLQVSGRRRRAADGTWSEPGTFARTELVAELTASGDENPNGMVNAARAQVRYADGRSGPAMFGPVSRYAKARKGLLGDEARRALAEPVMRIVHGFDWAYFQYAPSDQRAAHLLGNETILLDGFHPQPRKITLPDVAARAWLTRPGAARQELRMSADTLCLDTGRQEMSLCWRGHMALGPQTSECESLTGWAGITIAGCLLQAELKTMRMDMRPAAMAADDDKTAAVNKPAPDRTAALVDGGDMVAPYQLAQAGQRGADRRAPLVKSTPWDDEGTFQLVDASAASETTSPYELAPTTAEQGQKPQAPAIAGSPWGQAAEAVPTELAGRTLDLRHARERGAYRPLGHAPQRTERAETMTPTASAAAAAVGPAAATPEKTTPDKKAPSLAEKLRRAGASEDDIAALRDAFGEI